MKKDHWSKICTSSKTKDVMKAWTEIKRIFGNDKSSSIPTLKFNNTTANSDIEKCEIFADSLEKCFTLDFQNFNLCKEANSFSLPDLTNSNDIPYFSKEELFEAAKTLKKRSAAGPSSIKNIQILHSLTCPSFTSTILKFFNFSLDYSILPTTWKTAKVKMILKKNKNPSLPDSYRPISLLDCIAKLLEKLINRRLTDFLESNNKISIFQSGFRKHRSTSDHITRLIQNVKEGFNNLKITGAVFFDISKAFDRTWHNGILYKLDKIHTPLYLTKWIENFLLNRKFFINVNDQNSALRPIKAGVPQGSCLSPTLFSVYISDIADLITKNHPEVKVALYADDLCIWTSKRKKDELRIALQLAIDDIINFCSSWCLEINVDKSNYTIFTTAGHRSSYERLYSINLTTNNKLISLCPFPTFLGFSLDPKLSFHNSAVKTIEKANLRLNVIKTLKKKLHKNGITRKFLMKIYKGFIRPLFDYNHIPYLNISTGLQHKIQVFQNKVIRICLNESIYTRISDLHNEAKIPLLQTRLFHLSKVFLLKSISYNHLISQELDKFQVKPPKNYETLFKKRKTVMTPFSVLI